MHVLSLSTSVVEVSTPENVDVNENNDLTAAVDAETPTKNEDIVPTKTPPNTPDEGSQSRASPVTTITDELLPPDSSQNGGQSPEKEQVEAEQVEAVSEQNVVASDSNDVQD